MKMTPEQLVDHIDKVTKDYKGDITLLYGAIGVLSVGDALGWRVLRITLGSHTYTKYQRILGIDFKTQFEPKGRYAHKSLGLKIVEQADNFWNVVKGIESINHVEKKSLV
jgi:hypothetical protein